MNQILVSGGCKPGEEAFSRKRDRSPSPGDGRRLRAQISGATSTQDFCQGTDQSGGGESTLPAPDPTKGDRMRLIKIIQSMSSVHTLRIQSLVEKMDRVYVNTPRDLKIMEQDEKDIKKMVDVVSKSLRRRKGEAFRSEDIAIFGGPRESSSLEMNIKCIQNKILPFLRYHCFPDRTDFRVTDLISFSDYQRFARIHMNMVTDYNSTVGHSAASKKTDLYSWQVLCNAIADQARESVDDIGDVRLNHLKDWYKVLREDISPGLNILNVLASKHRRDKQHLIEETSDFLPMDQVIAKWVQSQTRHDWIENITNLSNNIRREYKAYIEVTAAEYSLVSDFVQTELSIYTPIRIGATGRLSMTTFARAQPAWLQEGDTDQERARPINQPPPDACWHQRSVGASKLAQMGWLAVSDIIIPCCPNAIRPSCFFAPNDQDKGGKTDSSIPFSRECYELVSAFIRIRNHYFGQYPDLVSSQKLATTFIFLRSNGREPGPTSSFKLNMLSKVVFGDGARRRITPQHIRKWNSTYLSQHPDPNVRLWRGPVTGNKDLIFERHYNLARQHMILKTLQVCRLRHRQEDTSIGWSEDFEKLRSSDKSAIIAANEALLFREEGVDLTSRKKPVHRHNRTRFRAELERHYPGLWKNATPKGLSSIKWVVEVISIIGLENAEELRNIVYNQYRGCENPAKRKWSGARSHFEKISTSSEEQSDNCPLTATLKLFYQSAKAYNRDNQDGTSSTEDSCSEED